MVLSALGSDVALHGTIGSDAVGRTLSELLGGRGVDLSFLKIVEAPTTITIQWTNRGVSKKCKIQVNVESISYEKIDEEFKAKFSVFMDDFDDTSFGRSKWESHNAENELAVKIAFLNVENTSFWNAIKALDKTTVLKKAIEAYRQKRDEFMSSEDDTDMSDVIASTLGSSLGNPKSCNVENFYFDN